MSDISVINEKGIRYYLVDGDKFVSVTTPLSLLSLPNIELWKVRVGRTKAEIIAKKAGNYGNKMHNYFDKVCCGKSFAVEKKYEKDIEAFRQWFDDNVEEVIATEKVVWSKKYQLAGRYDFLGRLKGHDGICIVDWKTGRIKPEHFLQLAAYRVLTSETDKIDKSEITQRLVVGVKEGKVKVIPPNKKKPKTDVNIDTDWEVYLNVLNIWHWVNKNK